MVRRAIQTESWTVDCDFGAAWQPGAKAGLREGDQIVQVNDQTPPGFIALNRLLTAPANHESRLQLLRARERRTITVELKPFDQVIREKLGLTFLDHRPPNIRSAAG